jgi:hypothetical protein
MLGDGQVTILLFLGAIAAVFVIEGRLLVEGARHDWLFVDVSLTQAVRSDSLIQTLRQLRNVVNYQRLRRAAYYRLWQWSGDGVFARAGEIARTLAALAGKIGLPLENKFEEVLTRSIPADRKIYPASGADHDGSLVVR